jgi:hypothetical protein
MPQMITLSTIQGLGFTAETFARAVEDFRAAKLAHRFTVGVPAPTPQHPVIEECVRRVPPAGMDDFVTDYELVDDSPSFEQRKQRLAGDVHRLEQEAIGHVIPPGRARLMQMDVDRIARKAAGEVTAADKEIVDAYRKRTRLIDDIRYHGAKLLAEVEDLTEASIDGWTPAKFPHTP